MERGYRKRKRHIMSYEINLRLRYSRRRRQRRGRSPAAPPAARKPPPDPAARRAGSILFASRLTSSL